ncbi:hypothetical protein BGZ63DRAFT_30504 [Mariannaea sp. PMI_226]|nr:hypothetical protein BGZ63DRAFT_30504 [Mariannaea sp. PMI_226]
MIIIVMVRKLMATAFLDCSMFSSSIPILSAVRSSKGPCPPYLALIIPYFLLLAITISSRRNHLTLQNLAENHRQASRASTDHTVALFAVPVRALFPSTFPCTLQQPSLKPNPTKDFSTLLVFFFLRKKGLKKKASHKYRHTESSPSSGYFRLACLRLVCACFSPSAGNCHRLENAHTTGHSPTHPSRLPQLPAENARPRHR